MPNTRILTSPDTAARRWLRLTSCEFRAYRRALERCGAVVADDSPDYTRWRARLNACNRAYRVWARRDHDSRR